MAELKDRYEIMDRRLAAQFAVTRALAESSSLSQATPKLLQYICEAVGFELGELWCVNAESNTLHIEGSWHLPTYEVDEFEKAGRKTILFPGIDLIGRVLQSGQPEWIDNVVDDSNFPRAIIAKRVGLHGAFAFPIPVADHISCVMAFYKRQVVQPDDELLQMFDALGRQVGDFIKRTRAEEERDKLLIYERVARSEAEINAEKLAFLAEASTVLTSSLDYHTNLMTVAKLAVNRLADWCAVDVVDEHNGFHRVALVHRDPLRTDWAREFQKRFSSTESAAPHGVAHVMRTGKAKIYTDIPDSMLIALAQDAEHFKILQELGLASAMVVPLVARERTLGAITFASENPARRYTDSDLSFAEDLARRAALGIDNARLYSETQGALREVRSKTDEIQQLNKDLEQRVRERTAQLEMMVKELEAFTYSISDDMRGPLRAIDGFSLVLMEEYPDKLDNEGKRLLNIIRTNASSLSELINGLLTFSRLGRQPLEQTDINMQELAKTVSDEVQAANKEREVRLNLAALPPAFGDRAMIRQVFYNLVSNAFKFTRPKQNWQIEIGFREEDNQHTYYVRDNGVGFDMQYSSKLFGVFQRLHNVEEFEGAGVGLALVQRIVLRHGGRVWAEGKVNEGATFYFSLPKA